MANKFLKSYKNILQLVITRIISIHYGCRDEVYSPEKVNERIPSFKHWGWLNPAGGLLTTLNDLAQVSILGIGNLHKKLFSEFFFGIRAIQ